MPMFDGLYFLFLRMDSGFVYVCMAARAPLAYYCYLCSMLVGSLEMLMYKYRGVCLPYQGRSKTFHSGASV